MRATIRCQRGRRRCRSCQEEQHRTGFLNAQMSHMARHTEAIFTRVQQFVTRDLRYNMEPVCRYVQDSNCRVKVATLPYQSVSRVLKLCIIALLVVSTGPYLVISFATT
jgi:hypothetical protein